MVNDEFKSPDVNNTSSELNGDSQNKKGNKGPIIVLIIVIVAVIAAIVGLVVVNINKNDKSSNETKNDTSANSEIKAEEKESGKKITNIIAQKEIKSDIVAGKYTAKVEYKFENGELTSYKARYYNIKDEYILENLKEAVKKEGFADRIEFGEDSFSYELTGAEFYENVNNKNAFTRNYVVSMLKKQGYTVTIEGDDSFLGDDKEKSEDIEKSYQLYEEETKKQVDILDYEDEIGEAIKKAQDYLNSEEGKKAQQEAIQKANEYIQNNKDEINDAAKKAQDYLNSEEGKKAQQEAQQKAQEYMKNNQEQIDAAKKRAEEMAKQYGF